MGPDHNLWFTEAGGNGGGAIGELIPTTSPPTIIETMTPTKNSGPMNITTGPDGNLWFTEIAANQIGRINPATHHIDEFGANILAGTGLEGIAAGVDGNLWFTESSLARIGLINPTTGMIQDSGLQVGAEPTDIVADPVGNLWVTEEAGRRIGWINLRATPRTFTEVSVSTAYGTPFHIAVGPDRNLWFTTGGNTIGLVSPALAPLAGYGVPPTTSETEDITSGPDGNVWFTDSSFSGGLGQITPATRAISRFALPPGSGATGITAGPNCTVWFTESDRNNIGEIT
jgi:streptogramin lyase